jgi:hypothetical protein
VAEAMEEHAQQQILLRTEQEESKKDLDKTPTIVDHNSQ